MADVGFASQPSLTPPNRSFGTVWHALDTTTQRSVAVKIVPVDGDSDLGELFREIDILKRCDNDFIVRYIGSHFTKGELWVRAPLRVS